MLAFPAWTVPTSPNILGTITNSQFATIAGINLVDGTNVYDGNVISTAQKGGA